MFEPILDRFSIEAGADLTSLPHFMEEHNREIYEAFHGPPFAWSSKPVGPSLARPPEGGHAD